MAGMKNVILASRTEDEDPECMRGESTVLRKLVTNFELNLDTNKVEPVNDYPNRLSKSPSHREDVKTTARRQQEEHDLIKGLSVS